MCLTVFIIFQYYYFFIYIIIITFLFYFIIILLLYYYITIFIRIRNPAKNVRFSKLGVKICLVLESEIFFRDEIDNTEGNI